MEEKYKDIDAVLIYCRVSDEKQVKMGHGLDSQEILCRNYIKLLGWTKEVEDVFREEGVSGKFLDRPTMDKLITYLDANSSKRYLIVFDDLKRFARNLEVHLQLRAEIKSRGALVASPNFNFEDSPTGRFVENVIASAAQLEREQNAVQVKEKMRARMLNGYWAFRALPTGYKYKVVDGHGKLAVPEEDIAQSINLVFQAILEQRIWSLEDARVALEDEYRKLGLSKTVSSNGIKRILSNRFYIGIIDYPPWEIMGIQGKHQAITTHEAFRAAQELLAHRSHKSKRKDYNPDFPLRPVVLCFLCDQPLTASWNKGRSSHYANYRCRNENCPFRNVSLPKEVVEASFEDFLSKITPHKQVIGLAQKIFRDLWEEMETKNQARVTEIGNDITRLESHIIALVERVSTSKNVTLIETYEAQIEAYQNQIEHLRMGQKELSKAFTKEEFGTASNKVFLYISEPVKMWKSGSYNDQKTLLEMYFEKGPKYDPEFGFGTANLTCLPKLLQVKASDQKSIVDLAGVEPASEN